MGDWGMGSPDHDPPGPGDERDDAEDRVRCPGCDEPLLDCVCPGDGDEGPGARS